MKKPTLFWHYPHLLFMMGGTKYILIVASRLRAHYELTIVTNKASPTVLAAFQQQQIPVICTTTKTTNDLVYWLCFPWYLLQDTRASLKLMKQGDVIFCTLFPSNVIAYINKLVNHRAYYFMCYEPFPFFHSQAFIARYHWSKQVLLQLLKLLYGWLDIKAAQGAQQILALDEYKSQLITDTYHVKPVVVGLGVDTDDFHPKHFSAQLQQQYSTTNLILHATDYSPVKGTQATIDAFALVAKKYPDARLLITSTQPDSPEKTGFVNQAARLGITNQVIHLGLLSEEHLRIHYATALCYLSTSNDVMTACNWPVKEALASGTPAIRSKVATTDVIDNVSGFLVEPNESQKIAKKIGFFIDHSEQARMMGLKGRKTIYELYSWEAVITKIRDVIHS